MMPKIPLSLTTVPVQGTFDIAQARNMLRLMVARQGWSTIFNARAATALTALGELILSVCSPKPIPIRIEAMGEEKQCGIKLSSVLYLSDDQPARWQEHILNLEQAAAGTEIRTLGSEIHIETHIWVK